MNTSRDDKGYPLGLRTAHGRNARLRSLIAASELLVAPGAYDCVGARLIEQSGFGALYLTGSGMSMSALGAPDVGLMSFSEILDRAARVADTVSIPVIVDADTGYGGPLNLIRTVREFERAGISGIQIEDQSWPKKCGHESGRNLVSSAEMEGRIKAAVDARVDPDLVLIARTDARSTDGIEAALERAARYVQAGADVIFVESPETEEELAIVARSVNVPVLANMVEGGRTPILPAGQLAKLGFSMAIYPNALTRCFAYAGLEMLRELAGSGTTAAMVPRMLSHRELWTLFEYEKWTATEQRLLHR
ncbi:isocitrate lyase/PEP mutase family protein [Candidimonas nitroreducens]|uniref:Carboxyvinyl-carboxyphosphonate phosphorylmutase n=1 Tax=Candidimonas nitroreducens TaxID=683354 RepID=A0A225MRP9_9BURK|nr:oxaloacetate decarboxylase [Candidimonas nitroreducens]OWT63712.1 carboxyvinyl-carboxyphosphonate phosphorylmutase [Candidimonas nitroreducens]